MSDEIIKVLDKIGEKFGIAIDWTRQNILPYLQDLGKRFIAYRNGCAVVQIAIGIMLIVAGIIATLKLIKWSKSDEFSKDRLSDDDVLLVFGMIGAIALMILGLGLIIANVIGIVKNMYMPELVIFEYIKTQAQ